MYSTAARLTLRIFHLYKTAWDSLYLDGILTLACDVLDQVRDLESSSRGLSTAQAGVSAVITQASFLLLRLLKSSRSLTVVLRDRAQASLFLAISVSKRMSYDSSDKPARCALILSQLWNSSKVFKNTDGSDHNRLRIRDRLAQGPVVDILRWWHDEFTLAGPKDPTSTTNRQGKLLLRPFSKVPIGVNADGVRIKITNWYRSRLPTQGWISQRYRRREKMCCCLLWMHHSRMISIGLFQWKIYSCPWSYSSLAVDDLRSLVT